MKTLAAVVSWSGVDIQCPIQDPWWWSDPRSVPRKVVRHPSIPPYTCHLTPRAGPLKDLTSNIKTSDIWHLPHSADLDTVAASSWFFLRRIFLPPIVSLGAPLVLCGPAHSCCRRVVFPTLEVESTFKVRKAALVDQSQVEKLNHQIRGIVYYVSQIHHVVKMLTLSPPGE